MSTHICQTHLNSSSGFPSHSKGSGGVDFLMWRQGWLRSSPSYLHGEDNMWCWHHIALKVHSLPRCGRGITVPQRLSLHIKQFFLALCTFLKRENLVLKTHSESFALRQCRLCQAGALVQVKKKKIIFKSCYKNVQKDLKNRSQFQISSFPVTTLVISQMRRNTWIYQTKSCVSEVSHTAYVYFCLYLRREWGPFFWKASLLLASDSASVITLIKRMAFYSRCYTVMNSWWLE